MLGLWLILVAAAFPLLLIARNAILVTIQAAEIHWLKARAVEKFAFVFVVIGWIGFAVLSEYRLRRTADLKSMLRVAVRFLGAELVALFLFHLILTLFTRHVGFPWDAVMLLTGEFLAALGCLFGPGIGRTRAD